MKLTKFDIETLEKFLDKIQSNIFPEPPSDLHNTITNKMIDYVIKKKIIPPNGKVLDVGCGQGPALELFATHGFRPVGITMGKDDLDICRQKGFEVYEMDQSFLGFEDEYFDFIWCRHCLEHSIMPYFTLFQLFRVLKSKGSLYVEVPAPDTSCNHQTNPNHFSVLGKSAWVELIRRTGFHITNFISIDITVGTGPDQYYVFVQSKP